MAAEKVDRLSWWVSEPPERFYALAREKFAESDGQPVKLTARGQSSESVKAERQGKRKRVDTDW